MPFARPIPANACLLPAHLLTVMMRPDLPQDGLLSCEKPLFEKSQYASPS
jgi:hypothetical protein